MWEFISKEEALSTAKSRGTRTPVLVTGATGFVGSHLVEALVARDYKVRVLARKTSDPRWIQDLPVSWCWGDVRDPASLHDAVQGVDWVFHLAGLTKAYGLEDYVAANAQGTRHLLEACVCSEPRPSKFVLMSSLAASGPCPSARPRRESDPPKPMSHYGQSKLQAEWAALSHADQISVILLRPPVVYGPREKDFLAFFRLIRKGWNLSVGQGDMRISMIHVRDLVEGILLAAEIEVPSGSAFFLSDGEIHEWEAVVALLGWIMGVLVRTVRIPASAAAVVAWGAEWGSRLRGRPPLVNRQKVREMLQESWACDIQRAKERLGFLPKIPLEEGLRDTYMWYRAQGWV
jgi:dihydroflavonol-4-reductase